MKINFIFIAVLLVTTVFSPIAGFSQALVSKAQMYFEHGLLADAKREAIEVIYSEASKEDIAKSKLLLAVIALEENRLSVASELLVSIIENHPEAEATKSAKDLLGKTISLTDFGLKNAVDNVVARGYFSNAEFHLSDLPSVFTIDTSYMDEVESPAFYWLDKIIAEFPETPSEEIARYYRIKAHLGKKGGMQYGIGGSGAWGYASTLLYNQEQAKQFPDPFYTKRIESQKISFIVEQKKAEEDFREFVKRFPDSNLVPKLRFMIGDSYWYIDDFDQAKPWLEEGSKTADGGEETFWTHLSRLRLRHWRGE